MAARNALGRILQLQACPLYAARRCTSCQGSSSSSGAALRPPSIAGRRFSSSSSPLPPTISAILSSPRSASPSLITVTARIISVRTHAKVTFLNITDGSLPSASPLQAVVRVVPSALPHDLAPGAVVKLRGALTPSKRDPSVLELLVDSNTDAVSSLVVNAPTQAALYPFPNTGAPPTPDAARRNAHLRSRLASHAAVLKMRSRAENAMANWFEEHDFVRVTAPSITTSDCEGAGEVFRVLGADEILESSSEPSNTQPPAVTPFFARNPAYLTVSSQLHLEALAQGLGRVWTCAPVWRAEGSATGRHLAEFWMAEPEWVLGSLSVAEYESPDSTGATSSIPQARATTDADLTELMDVAESLLKSMMRKALGLDAPAMSVARLDTLYLHTSGTNDGSVEGEQPTNLTELERYAASERWARMTYTAAIELLQQHLPSEEVSSDHHSSLPVAPQWGDSLSSAHERLLAGELVRGPVFVTDYPASQKAFYMRQSGGTRTDGQQDTRTVAAFDLLIPRLGELVGGSVREERADVLRDRLLESVAEQSVDAAVPSPNVNVGGLPPSPADGQQHSPATTAAHPLDWYTTDLRRFGAHRTGGFGIGIERLVAWLAGLDNVRDATAFPRTKGVLRF